jgi:hypothetical protein
MKVMCIDASLGRVSGTIPKFKEGDIVTASQCSISKDSFTISEHPLNKCGGSISWCKKRFIPCSGIDEMEILEERQQQLQETQN